jgi:hypothetical protein
MEIADDCAADASRSLIRFDRLIGNQSSGKTSDLRNNKQPVRVEKSP